MLTCRVHPLQRTVGWLSVDAAHARCTWCLLVCPWACSWFIPNVWHRAGVQRIKSAHARLLDTYVPPERCTERGGGGNSQPRFSRRNVRMRAIRAGSIWNGRVVVPPPTR